MSNSIVFGGASLSGVGGGYGFGELDGTKSSDLLDHAIARGVSIFDFAPIYGFNEAEKVMGQYLGAKRDQVKLISKAGVTWHDNMRVDMNNSPEVIHKMFDQSLKNFDSDYIDIYFIHWPSKDVDIRYSVEVLHNLKEKNKIKHIGLSNSFQEDFDKAQEVAKIEFLQSECNLFNQKPFKVDDAKSMGWGTFDKGILTSSVTAKRKFENSDARSHAFWWKKSKWKEKVKFVNEVKAKYDLNEAELRTLALHFSLKTVDYPIVGVKSIKQLDDVLDAVEVEQSQKYQEVSEKVIDEFSTF